jgi:hypothetical protein
MLLTLKSKKTKNLKVQKQFLELNKKRMIKRLSLTKQRITRKVPQRHEKYK